MDRTLLLLGILRVERMHGYQLHGLLEKHYGFVTDLKPSTTYYLLDQLAAQGFVRIQMEQPGNRPPRRVYEITEAGEAHFADLLRASLRTYQAPVSPEEMGLAFLGALAPEDAAAALTEKRAALAAELARLTGTEADLPPELRAGQRLALDHHLAILRAELAWLDGQVMRDKGQGTEE